jgi:hypothetical protein
MASVNWLTGEITVLKSDPAMTQTQATPTEIYELDTNALRLDLKSLEASVDGMPWPDTHIHATEVTLSGVTYVRFFEIIPPYFVTFEAPVGMGDFYRVDLVGSNNNIADVMTINGVSLVSDNSAGLIKVETGTSGLTAAESAALFGLEAYIIGGREYVLGPSSSDGLGWQRIQRDTSGTIIRRYNLYDDTDERINVSVAQFVAAPNMIFREELVT